MILCLNLNAAIDKTIVVSSLEVNKIHRPESVIALAGGKGCNVARALKTLGDEPVISGWVGGFAGQFIEAELHQEGIRTDFIQVDFESRTCTSILDREKQTTTEFYETGQPVPLQKIEALLAHLQATIGRYTAVTLSGSLPPGVATGFYGEVIKIAKTAGVLAFLDASGEALLKGVEAGPFFVKPNETEVKILLRTEPENWADFVQAAIEISTNYKTNVLLSMGARGAIAVGDGQALIARNPTVEALSAVGSGDCMLAGLVHGILNRFSFEDAIAGSVAAGTANTLTVGAGQFDIKEYQRLRGQVRITTS